MTMGWVTGIFDGPVGCHLDFHAPDWAEVARRLEYCITMRAPGLRVCGSLSGAIASGSGC